MLKFVLSLGLYLPSVIFFILYQLASYIVETFSYFPYIFLIVVMILDP